MALFFVMLFGNIPFFSSHSLSITCHFSCVRVYFCYCLLPHFHIKWCSYFFALLPPFERLSFVHMYIKLVYQSRTDTDRTRKWETKGKKKENKNKITIDETHKRDIYWNPKGVRFKHNIVIFISFSLIDKRRRWFFFTFVSRQQLVNIGPKSMHQVILANRQNKRRISNVCILIKSRRRSQIEPSKRHFLIHSV